MTSAGEFCAKCGAARESASDTYCRRCATKWPAARDQVESGTAGASAKTVGGGSARRSFLGGMFGCFGVIAAVVVLIGIVVVIVALAASGGSKATVVQTVPSSAAATTGTGSVAQPQKPNVLSLTIGQVAKVGDAQVTVNSFRTSSGGSFLKPKAGDIWVIVDATVKNTGSNAYDISSLLQTAVRDGTGREYDITIGPSTQGHLDGSIPPGDTLRGEGAYEVPTAAVGLQWVFKQAFGNQQARWNLK